MADAGAVHGQPPGTARLLALRGDRGDPQVVLGGEAEQVVVQMRIAQIRAVGRSRRARRGRHPAQSPARLGGVRLRARPDVLGCIAHVPIVSGRGRGGNSVTGFRHGARVVTAAAVIMISVFAGFIGSSDSMIKMIGFGLAIAVFFDAFLVRMAVVPAVLALLGRSAWWLPRWLRKLLPNVDVEGEGLRTQLAGTGTADGPDARAAREPARV